MKTIQLTQGKVALVDDADFKWLNQWKWRACLCDKVWYARSVMGYMHRVVLGLKRSSREGSHLNGDGLDNQRLNLSRATHMENAHHFQRPRPNKTSKFRGVSKHGRKWIAHIRVDYKARHLGLFVEEAAAAKAYDNAASEAFGKNAHLNFP